MNGESAPVLDYAQDPRRARWRRRVIRAGIVVSLALLFAVGRHYWGPVRLRVLQLYWARQCSEFTTSPGTPLNPKIVGRTELAEFGSNKNYVLFLGVATEVGSFRPQCWEKLRALVNSGTGTPRDMPTVFLHGMSTPASKRRIVHIHAVDDPRVRIADRLVATVIDAPTLLSPPRQVVIAASVPTFTGRMSDVRWTFGHADPNDPTRFSIGWEAVDGEKVLRRGSVDGYLTDYDTIRFQLRDPATTP